MKFGVCKTIDNAREIKDAGFDYIEINLAKICALSDGEFLNSVNHLKEVGLKAKTSNCFFPGDILLVGENVDFDKIKEYIQTALYRANEMGVEVTVLGSGKSRSLPDGFNRDVAVEQFSKTVKICSEIAKKYGIKIAIEPLSQRDSNFLNTVGETKVFCDGLGLENVGIAADFFHMYMNCESLEDFEDAKKYIFHLHIAKPDPSRIAPQEADKPTLEKWARSIKNIGYDCRMSLECTSKADFLTCLKDMNSVKYIFE